MVWVGEGRTVTYIHLIWTLVDELILDEILQIYIVG